MKIITITEKNSNQVFSKLEKFLRHEDYLLWHQFRGGMKKRLPHIVTHHNPFSYEDTKFDVTREVNNLIVERRDGTMLNLYWGPDHECGCSIKVRDKVAFLGNRVLIKIDYPSMEFNYLYMCFQIN